MDRSAHAQAFTQELALTLSVDHGRFPSVHKAKLTTKKNKKRELFYYRNISGEGIISHFSLISIQKNRRRVKLQSLQFHINSKTIKLQRVKTVFTFSKMVFKGRGRFREQVGLRPVVQAGGGVGR